MLAKVVEGQLVKYPYTLDDLKHDNPNTIFTIPLDASNLAEYGAVEILQVSPPAYDSEIEYVEEGTPILTEQGWIQTWTVLSFPEETITAHYNAKASWPGFYASLLTTAAFQKVRSLAATDLVVNVAYTDIAGALTLAVTGVVNLEAIQASFDNLLSLLTGDNSLTEIEQQELVTLLAAAYLDKLITLSFAS